MAEAIDSILNQTSTDFEFIIINDGSTDTTEMCGRKEWFSICLSGYAANSTQVEWRKSSVFSTTGFYGQIKIKFHRKKKQILCFDR